MVEYWLLERDQKMINDIVALSGKASLAGGGNKAAGARARCATRGAVIRTVRRVVRQKRGKNTQDALGRSTGHGDGHDDAAEGPGAERARRRRAARGRSPPGART